MYAISRVKENSYRLKNAKATSKKYQAEKKSPVPIHTLDNIRIFYHQRNEPTLQPQQIQDTRVSEIIQKCGDEEFIPDWEAMEEEIRRDQEETELFFQKYMQNSSETIPEKLILEITDDVCYGGSADRSRVWITMTGSRAEDKIQAQKQLEDKEKPIHPNETAGYAWHHIPNAGIDSGSCECQMILIKQDYHSKTHIGAVKQYERYNKTHYK
ncbi:MAG: hypothetical protein NC124_18720 [Clostridium sp.]|nr:hypothetical protein [Clostridium sp.]